MLNQIDYRRCNFSYFLILSHTISYFLIRFLLSHTVSYFLLLSPTFSYFLLLSHTFSYFLICFLLSHFLILSHTFARIFSHFLIIFLASRNLKATSIFISFNYKCSGKSNVIKPVLFDRQDKFNAIFIDARTRSDDTPWDETDNILNKVTAS